MNPEKRFIVFTTLVAAGLLASAYALLNKSAVLAQLPTVVAQKTKLITGERYTFTKYLDENGNVRGEVRNSQGRAISENAVPQGKTSLVDERVRQLMKQLQNTGRTIPVNIVLDLPEVVSQETPKMGRGQFVNGSAQRTSVNGRELSPNEFEQQANEHARQQQALQVQQAKARSEQLMQWARRHNLTNKEGLESAVKQSRGSVTLNLTVRELETLIRSGDKTIVGVELYEPSQDTISEAMRATSISTSALPYSSTRGGGVGIYMTESGCADPSRISNYIRLGGTETDHSRNVGAIIRAVSPSSFLYCRGGAVLPFTSDLAGVNGNSPIHIINRSNGGNETRTYNSWDRDWDNFIYQNNIPAFVSAGNSGTTNGNVISPAKGLNVIAVGNYNDANNTISSSSSYINPGTYNEKPEVSAPGTNITAGGFTMSGTSMSSPHAAAFTADMMSGVTALRYRPYLAKANLVAGATDSISGGYDKVGLGGIDFASAHWNGYWQWYTGSNSDFSYFDQQDGSTDGYVTLRVYIPNSWQRVRVGLSWLTRGTYTYSNLANAHPIGMDLDLQVYNPSGSYVGGSSSWDNPFESVTFTPTTSGYYSFKVNRFANRDTSLNLRMGLYVNYYNL